jgi:1-aminocyclopropane-1-carboxylate deaminase/D-cysteine desulfhydrase-like pyridoxal-dependent ACC family enzyme
VADLPIVRRFPALSTIPRASFGTYPTPVERVALADGRTLLLKRDDRSAPLVGGNKVRGLEWLLGAVRAGDTVLTVGPRGSTHALATAVYAGRLGARTTVVRWNQEMNAAAARVDERLRREARVLDSGWVVAAYAVAAALRVTERVVWIPAGGAAPLALLGHVNAALELAEQVARGESALPARVVVPFGTGGTAAGLALGFRIAGLRTRVVAVRVVPRVVGRVSRLVRLARSAAKLIEDRTGERIPRVGRDDVTIEQRFYGGAYGRPLAMTGTASLAADVALDDTYSRKAFAAALAGPSQSTLLWLTFDGRLLQDRTT